MGPAIKNVQWASALNKWSSRTKCIASSRCGPTISGFLYNFTALPVLGYLAQLITPPDNSHILERHALHHLFHMPPNALDLAHFFQLDLVGASAIKSLACFCQSFLFRAAHITIVGWREQLARLKMHRLELMPLSCLSSDVLAPPCWDTLPFVSPRSPSPPFSRTERASRLLNGSLGSLSNKLRAALSLNTSLRTLGLTCFAGA